jgi:hypothetical protein
MIRNGPWRLVLEDDVCGRRISFCTRRLEVSATICGIQGNRRLEKCRELGLQSACSGSQSEVEKRCLCRCKVVKTLTTMWCWLMVNPTG